MNLAGKRILVRGGRDFTDCPLLCRMLDGLFPALVPRLSDKSSFTASHPVPIVDEARRRRNAGPSAPGGRSGLRRPSRRVRVVEMVFSGARREHLRVTGYQRVGRGRAVARFAPRSRSGVAASHHAQLAALPSGSADPAVQWSSAPAVRPHGSRNAPPKHHAHTCPRTCPLNDRRSWTVLDVIDLLGCFWSEWHDLKPGTPTRNNPVIAYGNDTYVSGINRSSPWIESA
jgi:hypothetical protein